MTIGCAGEFAGWRILVIEDEHALASGRTCQSDAKLVLPMPAVAASGGRP